jgi:biopolymer transport protein TolQ
MDLTQISSTLSARIVAADGAGQPGLLDIVMHSGPVVFGILIMLLLMSVGAWAIIVHKAIQVRRAQSESIEFLETFWQSKRLDAIFKVSEKLVHSPVAQVFRAGYIELSKLKQQEASEGGEPGAPMGRQLDDIDSISRAMRRATTSEITHLESLVPFLATTGSSAPFIGLLGTVLGIMKSFHEIGLAGSASLATVAPGISEALIATAAGLFAAIPAVIAYNFFVSKIRVLDNEMESFGNDFLNIVKRHFMR